MIIGNIKEKSQINFLNKQELFRIAFDFLNNLDSYELSRGRKDISEKGVFIFYSEYRTHSVQEGVMEAHKRYLDIQYVLDGSERLLYTNVDHVKITKEYMEDDDVLLGTANHYSELVMKKGDFAVLFPEEAHMPGVTYGQASNVKKVVVKIPVN